MGLERPLSIQYRTIGVENMEYGLTSSTIKRIKLLNANKGQEKIYVISLKEFLLNNY